MNHLRLNGQSRKVSKQCRSRFEPPLISTNSASFGTARSHGTPCDARAILDLGYAQKPKQGHRETLMQLNVFLSLQRAVKVFAYKVSKCFQR